MNAIVVSDRQEITAQGITSGLFADFVAFIDRSEKTTRTYLTNLRQFMAWLRYTAISRPVRQDIISYRQWLTAEHDSIQLAPDTVSGWEYRTDGTGKPIKVSCKPSTVKAYLQSVKQFFSWTAANGYYPNIAANVHAPKTTTGHKKDGLTAPEVLTVERSIEAAAQEKTAAAEGMAKDKAGRIQRSTEQGKRLYAMYLLAVNAGLRTIEISRANIKDIETKGGRSWLYIWGKGHTSPDQKKPIAPEVKAAIDDYLTARTDVYTSASPLFVSTGNRSHGQRIAATTISTMLKTALKTAGFDSEHITAHSLRHTTAGNVMKITGNNIYAAQQYLRHNDPRTTEIYLENDTSEQDAIIAKRLYDHYHGIDEAGNLENIHSLIDTMNPAQLEQLTAIVKAMQH